MRVRRILFLFVVLPGLTAIVVCGQYLFSDWSALISAFARFERAAVSGDARSLAVAQYLDSVYRINAFADGVGVMLGAILFGIGMHGLCLLPATQVADQRVVRRVAVSEAIAAILVTGIVLGGAFALIKRVGSTNSLRWALGAGTSRHVVWKLGFAPP